MPAPFVFALAAFAVDAGISLRNKPPGSSGIRFSQFSTACWLGVRVCWLSSAARAIDCCCSFSGVCGSCCWLVEASLVSESSGFCSFRACCDGSWFWSVCSPREDCESEFCSFCCRESSDDCSCCPEEFCLSSDCCWFYPALDSALDSAS